jgi:hypothetical protein
MRRRPSGRALVGAGLGLLVVALLLVAASTLRCRPEIAFRLASLRLGADCFDVARPAEFSDDLIRSLVHLRTAAAADAARRNLIAYVWGTPDLPRDRLPDEVETGIADRDLAGMANLGRIDLLATKLDFGFVARAYHLVPADGNGRLAIYHEGHDGGFRDQARGTIEALLAAGFAVLALDMPMRGLNGWPASIDLPAIGPVPFGSASHWNLAILESPGFTPLRLFLDPILRGVNHLEQRHGYRQIVMLGISGGGWATTVYAALDPRIARSYPVAGTLPFFLRQPHPGSGRFTGDGDYEQRAPGLYRIANYLDLYVLGSIGAGRRQVQIVNKYDPCCFFGDGAEIYAPEVSAAVAAIGLDGAYRLVVDDTHARHAISLHALALILADAAAR